MNLESEWVGQVDLSRANSLLSSKAESAAADWTFHGCRSPTEDISYKDEGLVERNYLRQVRSSETASVFSVQLCEPV
jgi:sulfite reductase alpha subunit-like flavoprotein